MSTMRPNRFANTAWILAAVFGLAACGGGGGVGGASPPETAVLGISILGSGSVASAPVGINCNADCSDDYSLNAVVTLVPSPGAGATFAGWSGDADCSDGSVTMSADRHCIARFTLTGGARIAAGSDFSLARSRSGALYSWGSDVAEALGNGVGAAGRSAPGSTTTAATFDSIATAPGARHSLAVERTTGRVLSWGDNTSGQLGDGSTSTRADPVVMRDATGAEVASAIAVAAGASHSLVLLANGDVLATGSNSNGQLGDGTTSPRQTAAKVGSVCGPGTAAIAVAAGSNFSLALCANGSVRAWGANAQGQLGDGSFTDRANPVTVDGLAGVTITAIAAGGEFALALDDEGFGWSWGSNARGQLGTESRVVARRNTPAKVGGFVGGIVIAAGLEHAIVVLTNNAVFAWGANDNGQVDPSAGAAAQFDSSHRVFLPAIVALAAGRTHSMAMDNAGAVWTWGGNSSGQLGIGSTTSPNQPSQIAALNLN